ncbi:chitobiosyldiphosphodolichol beta-mannosyltransferase-like [Lingula anatina]|uniref:Chitobiosyldiphosphodolichol beta-mannosyltransferase n=1 Tax=Lingula anatina TaxID=7574 RepID=A0A1S3K639_LINAN|nr:chitobiosyldiphosphodolichol beta-mannosyltransferase-like [Lingula anatina]|eukprot:XP_013417721.1 chitobiosyldiphosphodolichol beta-mannosyltransferase-like [Lingula anatina]
MLETPHFLRYLPKLLNYMFKVLWQSVVLCLTVLMTKKSSHILLQNPPAIPTLAVLWVVCLYRDSRLIVDWHNYGYTILGLTLGSRHPLVRFSKWYEGFFGRLADGNICVTQAMREDLAEKWNIRAVTMYDRPPLIFQECDQEKKHELFSKLKNEYSVFKDSNGQSVFVEKMETGEILEKDDRPALLVSSTSWTEDEDFSLLLSALEKYDQAVQSNRNLRLPHIICAITGKGPLKKYYQGKIEEKNLKHVKICTPWLAAEDYPKLLGSADLGVCLHTSSSGLDLPMKVVDMFGCCLPVCAIHFKCLHELVKHEENGLIFHNEKELAEQLQELLADFPKTTKLKRFNKCLREFQKLRWSETWKEQVWPLFR